MNDPINLNVEGPTQLIASGLNKIPGTAGVNMEGVADEKENELTLDLSDEELLLLSKQWTNKYAAYEAKIKPRQEANLTYYLGKQKLPLTTEYPVSANLLFEAEETFLPAALAKNPEPVVWAENSDAGNKIANDVKTMLQYHADALVLRRKLNRMVRHWSIYFIGVMKHGWDDEIQEIKSEVIRFPNRLKLDPDGYVDEYGDFIGWIGEPKTVTASELIEMFPKSAGYIKEMVENKLGTDIVYTEWWKDEYCFYTFKDKVLDKHKNQFFNQETQSIEADEDGVLSPMTHEAKNHFARPKKPYTFLSVFSLGQQPHDETGLIEQNIPNQNRITARDIQIEANIASSNNSVAFDGQNFNEETAAQALNSMKQTGRGVLVPQGKVGVRDAIVRFPAPELPQSIFTSQETDKNDLRSIFGTQGITSQPQNDDMTARGMILQQQYDNTRIGGGIGDALEQVADNIFNWWVQLYYVFYDEQHFAAIMGQMKSVEYVQLSQMNLTAKLIISVAPDSLKPKDEVSQMNMAQQLWQEQALDPKTLFTMLDFPDPQKSAESTVLWLIDKNAYLQLNFPELAQQLQQIQMQNQQAQMAANPQASVGAEPQGESPTPPQNVSSEPANASLGQVPINQ